MTLQERINAAHAGPGVLVDADGYAPAVQVPDDVDCRIFSDASPWWGRARIDHVEVRQARVVLERLTLGGLWWRNGYLGAIREVLCQEAGLRIGPAPEDAPARYPSALTLDGVHVRGGPLKIVTPNLVWTGGSVERTRGDLEIGTDADPGAVVLIGVRFEHDALRHLLLRGRSPVTLIGCHFVLTEVEIPEGAHPDTKLVGCTHVMCGVTDRRRRRSWWPF